MIADTPQAGSILLPLLAISGAAAMAAAAAWFYTSQSLALYSADLRAGRAQNAALNAALEEADSFVSPGGERLICRTNTAGRIAPVSITLCADIHPQIELTGAVTDGSLTPLPGFDFERIYQGDSGCSERRQLPDLSRTLSGFRLTPQAALSAAVCTKLPPGAISAFTALSNLDSAEAVELDAHSDQPAVLAARGYIDLPAELTAAGKVMIIAAGDLHLGRLIPGSRPAEVLLLSASGCISVEFIHAAIKIRAVGKRGVFLPPADYEIAALTPPLRRIDVLGLTK